MKVVSVFFDSAQCCVSLPTATHHACKMADGELEVGTGASEGELEDGEVLSSEEEEEEEGEVREPEEKAKGEGDDVIAETSDSGRTATKRPAPDSAHAASPKVLGVCTMYMYMYIYSTCSFFS